MTRVWELSLDLPPTMLDDLGLFPTLHWHVQRYPARTRVRVVFAPACRATFVSASCTMR